MSHPTRILLATALLFWLNRCSSPLAGGSTTETTNTVVASVIDSSGAQVSGAVARLRPADYLVSEFPTGGGDPRTVRDMVTDRKGRVRFDSLPPGAYVLEFNDRKGDATMSRFEILGTGKHLDLAPSALAPSAEIKGIVETDPAAGKVHIEIYGLERQILVDSQTGRFSMPGLPAGSHKVRAFAEFEDYGSVDRVVPELAPGQVLALDTIQLTAWAMEDYGHWLHSKAVRINTTASGADVSGEILGFPLQIGLDRSNFDFAQAHPEGQDIRFAKPDGTKLPYEIGYWDPDSGRASVWVLVDTIRGNDDSQALRMYWGKARTSDFSNGTRVFRTAEGYAGVWHLDGGGLDAASNRLHGEIQGVRFQLGRLGLSAAFTGPTDRIRVPNQPGLGLGTGDFAASIWVDLDKLGSVQQLFCKREPMGGHFEIQVQADGKARAHLKRLDTGTYLESAKPLAPGQWHHLSLTRSGAEVRMYMDGNPVDTLDFPGDVDSQSDLLLGQDINEFEPLHGKLEELQLIGRSRSPEWIKLQYETGKPGSTAIRLE